MSNLQSFFYDTTEYVKFLHKKNHNKIYEQITLRGRIRIQYKVSLGTRYTGAKLGCRKEKWQRVGKV